MSQSEICSLYVEHEHQRVYASPPFLILGSYVRARGFPRLVPDAGWEPRLRAANIDAKLIEVARRWFEQSKPDVYGDEIDNLSWDVVGELAKSRGLLLISHDAAEPVRSTAQLMAAVERDAKWSADRLAGRREED